MADNTDNQKETGDEEILRVAKERFKLAEEAWRDVYLMAAEDNEFIAGDQWPEEIRRLREQENRPTLTINRLSTTVNQVVNDGRQNRPAIRVSPVDDKADIETARIRQGIIRHIERNSNAANAYDTGFEGAVRGGLGFFGLKTDYENEKSFNLEAKFRQLPDFTKVYLDPFFQEPDGSDANWGFIFDDVPKDDYKSEYKESELTRERSWETYFDNHQDWITEKSCRVAEYYTKDYKEVEIVQLPDGQVMQMDELSKELQEAAQKLPRRKTKITNIKWYKLNSAEILERTEIPGKYIPIIPVLGNKLIIKGKLVLESLIRHSKDSQRAHNFMVTSETEAIALAPKAPYMVAEGQIPEEYEQMWLTANTKTHPFLVYKQTDVNGQVAPPPQRNTYEPPVGAITNARLQSADDIKHTTGLFDASMGQRSNETSGKAIEGRQRQAQTTNFHFTDNLNRSIQHGGRILNDWIPVLYDTKRAVRMIGDEDDEAVIQILDETFKYKGEPKLIDFSVGQYDVSVDAGPSYATKRQEAATTTLELARTVPTLMQVAPDLVINNLDIPGAKEIAERMKKTVDPKLIDNKDQKPIPPEVQAQMGEMGQMIEQMTEKLKSQDEQINTKKMELESKERIENAKLQNALVLEQMKIQGSAANAVFLAELEGIKQRLGLLDQYAPINDDFSDEQSPDQMMPAQYEPENTQQQPPEEQSFGPNMGV